MILTESLDIQGHNIIMSAKPTLKNFPTFLRYIKKRKVKTIVVLMPTADIYQYYGFNLLDRYKDNDINVIHYPIEDFSVPKDLQHFDYFMAEIGDNLKESNVLIHCSAGLGRTGLVAAALLIRYKQASADKSIEVIRKSRYGTVETRGQENFLLKYDYYINGVQ